jgi:hypothetical protein
MNRRKVFGLLAIIAMVVSIGSAAAFAGFFAMDPAGGNAVLNAIKAKDFDAWKAAITAQLTEDNFNKLVERQTAMSQRRLNMSEKYGLVHGNQTLNIEMNKAIQEGNYGAWKTAATNANSPLLSKITSEDQFKLLVQLYQAKQDGNYSKVKELSQQLGLSMGNGRHKMYGHFGR